MSLARFGSLAQQAGQCQAFTIFTSGYLYASLIFNYKAVNLTPVNNAPATGLYRLGQLFMCFQC